MQTLWLPVWAALEVIEILSESLCILLNSACRSLLYPHNVPPFVYLLFFHYTLCQNCRHIFPVTIITPFVYVISQSMRIVLITFAWKFYRFISRSVRHDPSVKLMGIPWEQLLSRYLPLIYFYSESEFLIWFLYYSNWTCPVTVPVDFIILKYFSYRSIRILHNSFMSNHESLK